MYTELFRSTTQGKEMSTEKPHELAMGKPKMTHELTRKELEMSFEKPNQMSNNSKLNVSPSKPKGSSRPVDDPTHENKSSPAFPSDPGSIPHEPRSRRLPEWFTPLSEWTEERSAASTRDLAMRLYGTPTSSYHLISICSLN